VQGWGGDEIWGEKFSAFEKRKKEEKKKEGGGRPEKINQVSVGKQRKGGKRY